MIDATREWSGATGVFIGGKSMGGRMATHLGAQGSTGCSGSSRSAIRCIHQGVRTSRAPSTCRRFGVPVLIVQGERDTFGTPDELKPVVATLKAKTTLHVVPGGDHRSPSAVARRTWSSRECSIVASWISANQPHSDVVISSRISAARR